MLNRLLLITLLLAILPGCALFATNEEEDSPEESLTAQSMYREAKDAMEAGDYETAIQRYEALEARFPFGKLAEQAQLDVAYAYYKYDEHESAVAAADRFIKLYPRHERVDYAYYLKGVVKFSQGQGSFDFLSSQDPSKRDPESARKAFQYFTELVQRFPKSQYAEDAIYRMVYLRNALARHELNAARYYMKRQAYLAAANRAKYIIETFQQSPTIPDALVLMTEAYLQLKLHDLAYDSYRVLKLNFPKHAAVKRLTKQVRKPV
ncbi:MAG: outer membrane protein assembly factor BamD [Gammaproteobacteria bacterium]|nr:outer membrane protein assembly factor BamD [Gammaproteobacteria bacterium]